MSCVTVFPKWKSKVRVPLPQSINNTLRNTDECTHMHVHTHTWEKQKTPWNREQKLGKFLCLHLNGWLLECHLEMHHFHTAQWLTCPYPFSIRFSIVVVFMFIPSVFKPLYLCSVQNTMICLSLFSPTKQLGFKKHFLVWKQGKSGDAAFKLLTL